jgi:DNA-binding response OmpR family regulator
MAKILLVEDDRVASRLIENLLYRKGHTLRILADGRSAFDFISSGQEIPDLVLLDLMLPFIDGFALLKFIRSNSLWQKVPIIMLTSKGQEKNIVRAFELGADDYILKPFNREELAVRVRRQMK